MRRMYSKEQLLNMIENKYGFYIVEYSEDFPEVLQIMPLLNLDVVDTASFNGIVNFQGEQVYFLTNNIIFADLPTEDPGEVGQLWNDNGTLKISTGE